MKEEEIKSFKEKLSKINFLELKEEGIRRELTKLGVLIGDIFKMTNTKYVNAFIEEPLIKDLKNLREG